MLYVADKNALVKSNLRRTLSANDNTQLSTHVSEILKAVARDGDTAILALTERYDQKRFESVEAMRLPESILESALTAIDPGLKAALYQAKENIEAFHSKQKPSNVVWDQPGKTLELCFSPLSRVALYVPGGLAAYPSSVLMNAVPAIAAGVKEIAVFTPPTSNHAQMEAVYATCAMLGLTEVYTIGGAQAIAAAAYGTQTIPACDLITGPGNQFVTEAKRQVMDFVKIDMLAGPSELLIVLDHTSNISFVAADLLAQAEHDALAGLFVVCVGEEDTCEILAKKIRLEIRNQLQIMDSQNAALSIENLCVYGCPSIEEASEISNAIAPEHLSLQFSNAQAYAKAFTSAGSIFIGPYTPEAVADYAAGSNHVLPTAGTSRFTSNLSVLTFLKSTQYVTYTQEGLQSDGLASMVIAQRERLPYHAKSLALRLEMSLRLNANENQVFENGPTLEAVESNHLRAYPDAMYTALKTDLLKALTNLYPKKFEAVALSTREQADQIALGNGSDELLDMILRGLLPNASRVGILSPSFSEYDRLLKINRHISVPLTATYKDGWFDEETLLQALIKKARCTDQALNAILLCNPNNPTGQYFSLKWIQRLIDQVPAECLIVLDEAYIDFESEQDQAPWFAWQYPNVIQVRTLSKAFRAAGIRLGYALMNPQYNQKLSAYLAPYRITHPTVTYARQILQGLSQEFGANKFRQLRKAIQLERSDLAMSFGLPQRPYGGNFLWLNLNRQQQEGLDRLHIQTRRFDGAWAAYSRLTIGNPLQMTMIKNILSSGASSENIS